MRTLKWKQRLRPRLWPAERDKMSDLVTLTIDGIEVTVPKGTLVVDAAKRVGIDIPVFCYHPKMEPVGMCRMCLVEIGLPVRDRRQEARAGRERLESTSGARADRMHCAG